MGYLQRKLHYHQTDRLRTSPLAFLKSGESPSNQPSSFLVGPLLLSWFNSNASTSKRAIQTNKLNFPSKLPSFVTSTWTPFVVYPVWAWTIQLILQPMLQLMLQLVTNSSHERNSCNSKAVDHVMYWFVENTCMDGCRCCYSNLI